MFGDEDADQLNYILSKLACCSLLKFQPEAISATNSLTYWFQWESVQGRLPEKNVKLRWRRMVRRDCSDVNSTRAGSFLLFLWYIDNIPDCLLWEEQLQWGVSHKWLGGFVTYQLLKVILHSSLHSLDVDLHPCSLLFSFLFGLFPLLSPCFLPFSSPSSLSQERERERANNLF